MCCTTEIHFLFILSQRVLQDEKKNNNAVELQKSYMQMLARQHLTEMIGQGKITGFHFAHWVEKECCQ